MNTLYNKHAYLGGNMNVDPEAVVVVAKLVDGHRVLVDDVDLPERVFVRVQANMSTYLYPLTSWCK